MRTKTEAFIFLIIILNSVFLLGCKKGEDGSNNECVFAGTSNLSMTVQGNNWVADCGSWLTNTFFGTTSLSIGGTRNSDDTNFSFFLRGGFNGNNTYDLADTSILQLSLNSFSFMDTSYLIRSGTLNVTKYSNTELSGTFTFTADDGAGDTISITNGVFTDLLR